MDSADMGFPANIFPDLVPYGHAVRITLQYSHHQKDQFFEFTQMDSFHI